MIPVPKQIGYRLSTLRAERGLTQRQVAALIGADVSAISRYEAGKQAPRYKRLEKLAVFYNVPVEYLGGITK